MAGLTRGDDGPTSARRPPPGEPERNDRLDEKQDRGQEERDENGNERRERNGGDHREHETPEAVPEGRPDSVESVPPVERRLDPAPAGSSQEVELDAPPPPLRVGDRPRGQSPRRSSMVSLRRHFGEALTCSSRKILRPRRASIPGRAWRPISRTIEPPLPIRIIFWLSVSV